ncbi:hypothetical protein BSKO_04370 [Bryopsis sp. KO-2023]|nr:hypothetical protein BSKO_04370 [Bryopsis sp. KO-2023]
MRSLVGRGVVRSWSIFRRESALRVVSAVPSRSASGRAKGKGKGKPNDGDDEELKKKKAQMLEDAIKKLNADYGKGHLMRLGDVEFQKVETTSSGAMSLDLALGGGFPKGRIVEIFGPESSGKTSMALSAMAAVQKEGGNVVLIDAEHAFDPVYAQKIGVVIDDLFMCQPSSGEEALETVDRLARTGTVSMICVDSVSALMPRSELQGEMGQAQVGVQARMMSQGLRKLVESASKFGCTILFINQIRYKIGVLYGNPETTSGGNALKFYSSVRLDVRKKEQLGTDKEKPIGIKIKCKVVKNKVAPPFRVAEVDFLFESGVNKVGCTLDAAEKLGVVKANGAWYYMGDTKLGQGRDRVIEYLKSSPEVLEEIETKTRLCFTESDDALGTGPVDVDVDVDGEVSDGDDAVRQQDIAA